MNHLQTRHAREWSLFASDNEGRLASLWQADDVIVGTPDADTLTGTAGDDTLLGLEGRDLLTGDAGNDSIIGGAGQDTAYGGDGDDTLDGTVEGSSGGYDSLFGEAGNDTLIIDKGTADGGDGNDLLRSIGLADGGAFLRGEDGDDTLIGDAYAYEYGGFGNDLLISGEEGSAMNGDAGNDTLNGAADHDALDGGKGYDLLNAGGGDDLLRDSDRNADTIDGGSGYDTLDADYRNSTDDIIWVNDPDNLQLVNGNFVSGIEQMDLRLGSGDDVVTNTHAGFGWLQGDRMYGGPGHDRLTASGGSDTLNGGVGNDTLTGTDGVSYLYGGANLDMLYGGDGDDDMSGGNGADTLSGGAGRDWFEFGDPATGADVIVDFESGVDEFITRESYIRIGDGDSTIDDATVIAGPGGFSRNAELVIATTDIAGAITATTAAAAIGSATSAYAVGRKALFVVDNGSDTAVYLFKSGAADATVSAAELTLMATLDGTEQTAVDDYMFNP